MDPAQVVAGAVGAEPPREERRATDARERLTDQGWLCQLALRAGQFWDFIDKRDIDKHLSFWALMYGTVKITEWGMIFASLHPDMDGLKMAAVIGAVLGPYTVLMTAATKWYYERLTGQ